MVITQTAIIEVFTVDSEDCNVEFLLSFGEDGVLEDGRATFGTMVSWTDLAEWALTDCSHGIVEEVVGKTKAMGGGRVEE